MHRNAFSIYSHCKSLVSEKSDVKKKGMEFIIAQNSASERVPGYFSVGIHILKISADCFANIDKVIKNKKVITDF